MSEHHFNFMDLPDLVQEMIVEKIVDYYEPKNRFHFMLASKFCKDLIDRCHPKKIIQNLVIIFCKDHFEIQVAYFNVKKSLDSEPELITDSFVKFESIPEYLTQLQVLDYCKLRFEIVDDYENRKYTRILPILAKTLEFVQKIHLEFEILHKNESEFIIKLINNLKNCNSLDWSVLYPGEKIPCFDLIDAIPKTSKIGLMGFTDVDDEFLDKFAEKTNEENPLINLYLSSQKYFTLNGIQNFLEKATFGKKSRIMIFPLNFQRIPFLRMLTTLGKIIQNQNISFVDFYYKGSVITFCLQQV